VAEEEDEYLDDSFEVDSDFEDDPETTQADSGGSTSA
jgi:hypothetical protein